MIANLRFAFIGGGNMAEALLKGLLIGLQVAPDHITATDVVPERLTYLETTYKIGTSMDNAQAVRDHDVMILAVKPQTIPEVTRVMAPAMTRDKLVISIAAGITLQTLEQGLGADMRMVRVMPNTPALVLAGAAGIAPGPAATPQDTEVVECIFNAVGRAVVVNEGLMDAVTGLSGSGPAYVFAFIEALSDGGVMMGLTRPMATQLAAQTVLGAAQLVLETGKHPGELKDMVTSPAGTTIMGMQALESGGLRGLMMDVVRRATERSVELGRNSDH